MFIATRCSVLVTAVSATLFAAVSSAEIVSTSFDDKIISLDLTTAGAKDWAVFGAVRASGADELLGVIDFKKGGTGITKKLIASSLTNAFGGDGIEGSQWTGGSWGWSDGTHQESLRLEFALRSQRRPQMIWHESGGCI